MRLIFLIPFIMIFCGASEEAVIIAVMSVAIIYPILREVKNHAVHWESSKYAEREAN